eukprot:5297104-Pyramimonas_sp.AAC.1
MRHMRMLVRANTSCYENACGVLRASAGNNPTGYQLDSPIPRKPEQANATSAAPEKMNSRLSEAYSNGSELFRASES